MIFVGVFVCREESYFCNNFPQGEPQHSCLCVHVYLLVYAAIFLFFCFALSKPVSRKQKWRTLKRINQRKTKFNIFSLSVALLKNVFFLFFFSKHTYKAKINRLLIFCWMLERKKEENNNKDEKRHRKKKLERERERGSKRKG